MIIGVAGTNGAGKGEIVKFLEGQGFHAVSLSDIIRDECRNRGLEITRENLIKLGNELRESHGHGVLAEKILEKIKENNWSEVVVDSIRHPVEVDALKKEENFSLVFVDAPINIRYERIKQRKREGEENTSLEEFKNQEQIIGQGAQQQLGMVSALADKHIDNDGSLLDLHKRIYKFVQKKRDVYIERPDWDSYFIGLSKEVAKRATCDRGRSGCVIVKDKKLLTTGYVGSAVGAPHCDEVGHLMKKTLMEDGSIKFGCVRTAHAEQNAIVQAAKHGISIDGGTLYCKMEPCSVCAKMIVNSGIKKVVCEKAYHGAFDTREIFNSADVDLKILDDNFENYATQ